VKTLKLYNVSLSLKSLTLDLPVAAVSRPAAKRQAREYYPMAKSINRVEQVGIVNVPVSA